MCGPGPRLARRSAWWGWGLLLSVLLCGVVSAQRISAAKDGDIVNVLEKELKKYSSKEPNALKCVKRLWEKNVFFAQRGASADFVSSTVV